MYLVDANVVLRYILNDHPDLSVKASDIIENYKVIVVTEVMCEIVYVLQKVYNVPREEIKTKIYDLVDENLITLEKQDVIKQALSTYCKKNIDIVDAILWAYHAVENKNIFTFDNKLNKYLEDNF